MRIASIEASWIRVPIDPAEHIRSDYGAMREFGLVVVRVRTDDGLEGIGETKAGGGAISTNHALLAMIREEIAPRLVGRDPRQVSRIFEEAYNGGRVDSALERGRSMPSVGARGLAMFAFSAIDLALWDLLGKSLGVPVHALLGGPLRDSLALYGSGGWAGLDGIGDELRGYAAHGFGALKMRIGVAYGAVGTSIARVLAAREALGPDIGLMVDAHGTFSASEAALFARETETCRLAWFEEPVSSDNPEALPRLRALTATPIATGENELDRFAFRDLINAGVDVVQPDLAICGGLTEGLRIAALASAHQVELAPHVWGGAILLAASAHLAAVSPAFSILEYPAASNPVVRGLAADPWPTEGGRMAIPDAPGFGVTLDEDFLREHRVA